jgi:ribosomal protein S8
MRFNNSLAALNGALVYKKITSSIPNNPKYYKIIKLLYKSRYLDNYSTTYYNINTRFNIYNNENILNKLKIMYKPGYRSGITHKKLKTLQKNKNKTYIISGLRGIKYSTSYIKHNMGGNALTEVI